MKIKSIKVMFGGNILTLCNGKSYKAYYANDGKEKIDVDGVLYEVNNTQWEVKKCHYQPLKKVK